jgi:hypothetical protein
MKESDLKITNKRIFKQNNMLGYWIMDFPGMIRPLQTFIVFALIWHFWQKIKF